MHRAAQFCYGARVESVCNELLIIRVILTQTMFHASRTDSVILPRYSVQMPGKKQGKGSGSLVVILGSLLLLLRRFSAASRSTVYLGGVAMACRVHRCHGKKTQIARDGSESTSTSLVQRGTRFGLFPRIATGLRGCNMAYSTDIHTRCAHGDRNQAVCGKKKKSHDYFNVSQSGLGEVPNVRSARMLTTLTKLISVSSRLCRAYPLPRHLKFGVAIRRGYEY